MKIDLVPALMVDQFWPLIAEGLHESAMKTGGDLTVSYLWQICRSGPGFLFLAQDGEMIHGASVWRFDTWETGTRFRCLALAGKNMDLWIEPMHARVTETAKLGKAKALVAEGRDGWVKVFTKARKVRTLYEEDLT